MAAHRYWRIQCIGTGEYWLAGVNLREVSGGASLAGTAVESGHYSSYTSGNAFDTNAGTFWASNTTTDPWVGLDLGSGVTADVVQYVLDPGAAASSCPPGVRLAYSDDGVAWTVADSRPSVTWVNGVPQTFDIVTNWAALSAPPPNLSATASGLADVANAALFAPAPLLSAFSGGTSSLMPPSAVCTLYGGATSTLSPPPPVLRAIAGSNSSLTAPRPTLYALAHDSTGELSATLTAPSPTLSAYAGASSKLTAPTQVLTSSGTVTGWASTALSAPSPTLIATGTVSGVATAALKAPSQNLVGYGGAVCSITLTGSPTLQASATTGGIGSAALSCPLFELTATATAQNHGSANLLAPSPRMGQTAQAWLVAPGARLSAIGSAVITATYEAYAVNLKHTARPGTEPIDEATRYTNFPFTHVIRHKGSYYGANSTGLYLLEGTTDDAVPITWAVKTAMTDFKSPQRKTVASAYFGGRLGPADTITLHAGEGAQTQPYSYTTPRGALAQNYRQAFGKGIKQHRYYALAASGSGEMALDNIDLDVHNLTRRI